MDIGTRACIAAAAFGIVSQRSPSSVYDYARSRYVTISGSVGNESVALYDYERSCHFSGSFTSLYDYGRSCHISININGSHFSGYDYGVGCHFNGTVSGNSVSVYDYEDGAYYNYSC
jgi:hypothetical protein